MINDLKQKLDELIEKYGELEGISVRRPLMTEVKKYVAYISASNGRLAEEEAAFLSELLGRTVSPGDFANYISAEFGTKVDVSNWIPSLYCKHIKNAELSYEYIALFAAIGKEAVVCDKKAEEEEVQAYTAYMGMLRAFYTAANPDSPLPPEFDFDIEKTAGGTNNPADEETLEDLLAELNGLIGLGSVKRNVHSLLHLQTIQREREKRGLPGIVMSNHLVFTGNPGTGKTTVARLIARIYNKIGLLSTGNFVEVDRSGLVAGYVGQTAIEVKNVMDTAKGGVLFIDEAYSLANGLQGDYGMEAIETLLKRMEDDREDMIVIVAGYPKLMEKFISSNPGLRSRFSKKIHFPDYDPDELLEILQYMVKKNGFMITEEALDLAYEELENRYNTRDDDFANAREVRNYFESAVVKQADRLYGRENLTDEELCTLDAEDFKFNEIMM